MTSYKNNKAFTLIELLVVISIIGMLSSVVMASLAGAREKGRIASVIKFTTNNYHKLGVNSLLLLDFNEGNSVKPVDSAGNFTANITVTHDSRTPFSSGTSFRSPGSSNDYLSMNKKSSSNVLLPDTKGFTMSLWFNNLGSSQSGKQLLSTVITTSHTIPTLYPYISLNGLSQVICYNGSIPLTGPSVNDSLWHNVTCTTSDSKVSMYFDGKLVAGPSNSYANTYNISSSVMVGGSFGSKFSGLIDDVSIYSGSLTASEVFRLYAEGLESHKIAEVK